MHSAGLSKLVLLTCSMLLDLGELTLCSSYPHQRTIAFEKKKLNSQKREQQLTEGNIDTQNQSLYKTMPFFWAVTCFLPWPPAVPLPRIAWQWWLAQRSEFKVAPCSCSLQTDVCGITPPLSLGRHTLLSVTVCDLLKPDRMNVPSSAYLSSNAMRALQQENTYLYYRLSFLLA